MPSGHPLPGPAGSDARIVHLLELLSATPAPHGSELAAARALALAGREAFPRLGWRVDPYGADAANVVVTAGDADGVPAVLFVSHLDTSLSGDPEDDAPVTGRSDVPAGLSYDGTSVAGFGLGVARAPAAAALLALDLIAAAGSPARPVQVLLAGSGTHRSALPSPLPAGRVVPSSSAGAMHHLRTAARPDAVVVAKCGPRAVLAGEPGAAYVALTVTGGWGAALAPGSAEPAGGVLPHAGAVLDAVAAWREQFVADRRGRADGLAGEVGVGALLGGRPDKPDLLPASLDARLYLVTVPGDDVAALADDLAAFVRRRLAATPLAGCAVTAQAEPLHAAGITAADEPVVLHAYAAWDSAFGDRPEPARDWTGSTDGVVFRAAGVPTVRLGPSSRTDREDRRRDVLAVPELVAFASVYADLAQRLLAAPSPYPPNRGT